MAFSVTLTFNYFLTFPTGPQMSVVESTFQTQRYSDSEKNIKSSHLSKYFKLRIDQSVRLYLHSTSHQRQLHVLNLKRA